jgi:hypothetical protein
MLKLDDIETRRRGWQKIERKDYRKEVGIANFSSSDPYKREIMPEEQEENYVNTER